MRRLESRLRRASGIARYLFLLLVVSIGTSSASAHETGDVAGGFVSGVTHPLFGLDHLVAMIAVGLWGAQLKQPAIWLLPITFPLVMAFGGVLGIRGLPIPAVEIGIALSAVVLGAAVMIAARPPVGIAAVLVGAFAILHGHAHGAELPESATPLAYGAGFVLSTGLLHAAGITLGLLVRWPAGEQAIRILGGGIALAGGYFLIQCLSAGG